VSAVQPVSDTAVNRGFGKAGEAAATPVPAREPDWAPNDRLAGLPVATADDHRRGMRQLAASVSIVTARNGERRAGLTATAVCSVTADPPRLVVFVNKSVVANEVIRESGAVCINVVAAAQETVAKAFAGMIDGVHGDARFEYGQWDTMVTGAPALGDALVNFDCRVIKVFDESTHHAFVAEVLATRVCESGDALVYLNGAFLNLGA
jgi:flavin reductase (DIM6/NTAB) family NADH-FMN oxidoreductase RutF